MEQTTGIVTNCTNLALLDAASSEADTIGLVSCLTEVIVEESIDGFYQVCLASGIEGFCEQRFISVRG